MAHIENVGNASVSTDPNSIPELQGSHKIKIAVLADTSKIWRYNEAAASGQKWAELKVGNHVLADITDYLGVANADFYNKWNLKTNGFQRTGIFSEDSVDLVAGANVNISYSAGGVVTFSVPNAIYVHPSDGVDLGSALTGATVISDVDVNSKGHVTGFATRDLALANLGFTGDNNANYVNTDEILNSTMTGLSEGGELTINTDTSKFDVAIGFGRIVNGHTNVESPISTSVVWDTITGVTPQFLATHNASYVSMDLSGAVYQTSSPLTSTQRRHYIRLGVIVHPNRSSIFITNDQPSVHIEMGGQVQDVLEVLGFRSVSGNRILPAASTGMQIKKEAGVVFKPGANFKHLNSQPHFLSLAEQNVASFRYRLQNGNEGLTITTIDPTKYDLNGVLTAIPPTATLASVQQIYIFQEGDIRIQPGQKYYNNLAESILGINSAVFQTEENIAANGLYLGSIAMIYGTTDLANILQAVFVPSQGTTTNGSITLPPLGYTPEDEDKKAQTLTASSSLYPSNDAVIAAISAASYDDTGLQADRHTHANKVTLDKFGENGSGYPTYNGNNIDTTIAQRDVYDALDSNDNTISLSAKQGKVLNDNFNNYLKNTTDTLTGDLTVVGNVTANNGYFDGTLQNYSNTSDNIKIKAIRATKGQGHVGIEINGGSDSVTWLTRMSTNNDDLLLYVGSDLVSLYRPDKSVHFSSTVSALGGDSTQWNQAYAWGNHASAGYTGDQDLSGYVTLAGAQTLTGQKTFNTGSFNPLKLDRTGLTNVNMSFNHGGVLKGYLGVGDGGTLTWGSNANSGVNALIYHSGNIPTWNQNTTGNATTATRLANARTIAGVSFDGSANISLNNNNITNGAGYTGDQDLSGYSTTSHNHDSSYVKEGGTSFTGVYPIVVRVSARNIFSHADITFTGLDSSLFVGGSVKSPRFYGLNNVAYYLSPTSTSVLKSATFDSTVSAASFVGPLTGNASTATWADTVDVNGSNSGTGEFNIMWNSGDTVYSTAGITINRDAKRITASQFSGALLGNATTATNAVTVNGISTDRIVYGSGPNKTTTVSNLNVALPSGFYDASSATGSPTASWYTVINQRHTNASNNYGSQIATNFYDNGAMFVRTIANNVYQPWSKIWNEANDGLGSGLDADLLDGQHGSYYAPATGGSYLPLSGGTMTGVINTGSNNIIVSANKGFSNSGAWTRFSTPYGNIELGPANATWAHIYTDRPGFYFNKDLYVLGQKVLNASNYNEYAPTKTGTGASGTWGISISGSANTLDGIDSSSFLRSDADDTVNAGVTYTWTRTDTAGLVFVNNTYNTQLHIGGWTSTNSNDISRIRNSNGNLHIDSAANGALYLNNYSTGSIITTSIFQSSNSIRGSLFYDSNDTTYYLNPAGQSHLSTLTLAGNRIGFINSSFDAEIRVGDGNLNGTGADFVFYGDTVPGHAQITAKVGNFTADVRTPIFYDSNNTSYYGDFSSTTYGKYYGRRAHNEGFQVGSYNNVGANDAQSNPIYTIGSNYMPSTTSLVNMYGMGYTHAGSASFVSLSGCAGWGAYFASDGDARAFIDAQYGVIASTSSVRTPLFYDSNNTGYYLNPASTSNLNIVDANTFKGSYKSSDGTAGITGTKTIIDIDSDAQTITYKNGLIVAVS
jgi:hypothetical protein